MKTKSTKSIKEEKVSVYDSFDLPKQAIDLFLDVGAGICNSQKLSDSDNFTYDMSKVKEYKPKTKIPDIISELVRQTNYKDDYNWKCDNKFVSDGVIIEVVAYSIKTSDWCIVNMDGIEKKISKKYFKELYENRMVGL